MWNDHLKPLWDNLTDFFGSVSEFCLALWNNVLAPVVNYIVQKVGPPITLIVGTIGDVVGTVIAMISDIIGGIIKTLSGLLDFLTGIFTGNWDKAWNGIKKAFNGVWETMEGVAKGTINILIDGINMLWGGVYNVVKGIVDGIGGIAGSHRGYIRSGLAFFHACRASPYSETGVGRNCFRANPRYDRRV